MATSIQPPTLETSSRKQPKNLWTYSSTLKWPGKRRGTDRVPALLAILEVLREDPAWWDGWESPEDWIADHYGPLSVLEIAPLVGLGISRVDQICGNGQWGLAHRIPPTFRAQVREELRGAEEERCRGRMQGHRMRVRARRAGG